VIERMSGAIQPYAWGSPTFIPELLGEESNGEPQAELWLGAHPSAPSQVGDQSLAELVAQDPEVVLGSASVEAFGPRLPFLLKVLAAAKPLSLQAHPSRQQAEAGYARELGAGVAEDASNRLYKDDWPKPEVMCALTDTETLCGFREPGETYALFAQLGVARALALVTELNEAGMDAAERLETVFARLLRLGDGEVEVIDQVVAAAQHATGAGAFDQFLVTARDLGRSFPGDPGVLAALLLNRVSLKQNDAIFLPEGNLHAYLQGAGVEIMANSDNVMRGGLTPKHVDVEELLSLLDFRPGFAGLITSVELSPGLWRYPTPAPEFALWRVEPAGSTVELPASHLGRVLLATDGSLTLSSDSTEMTLTRGQSAFATAAETLRASGHGTLFVGGPGLA
jgi:mannose-6-phosphate isomerase